MKAAHSFFSPALRQALTSAALLLLTSAACAQSTPGPESVLAEVQLGRLFHTPQQRAVLDELRRRNARISHEQESDTISLQGIVRRSSGRSTVWINGQAHDNRAPVASFGERSARVFVGEGKTVELKVGEQVRIGNDTRDSKP